MCGEVTYDGKEGPIGVGNADCRLVKNRDLHIVCSSNVYTYICAHGRLASETRRMKEKKHLALVSLSNTPVQSWQSEIKKEIQ